MLRALVLGLGAAIGLAGCAVETGASQEEIASRAYVHPEPPSLTLYTVRRVADGSGGHTGLLINGPQQVLFDPAGSFTIEGVPERGDVHYGFSPRIQSVYIDYHARESWDVIEQVVEVSPEVAALALQLAQQAGPVGPARCSISVAQILRELPGFEDIRPVWYPMKLKEQFGNRTLVSNHVYTDDDADDNHGVLIRATRTLDVEGAS